jgi:WD40 repeat protein
MPTGSTVSFPRSGPLPTPQRPARRVTVYVVGVRTELRPGEELAGYRVEGVLGRGGMGVVYRVLDLRLERAAALKIIRPELSADGEFRARFHRESKLAASIRQPNVVTIYHAGEADGLLYVTMELIDGLDLGRLIAAAGSLAPPLAWELLVQIAAALDAAHSLGLVHRDVKPANVLVEEGAGVQAYLTDFGLTKRFEAEGDPVTREGFLGTVDYAAPEQIRQGPVGARADVYALGCVLVAMLCGEPPFPRANDTQTMFAHLHEAPPRISGLVEELPATLDPVVERALAKDPAERYASAGELTAAVGDALGLSADAQRAATPPRLEEPGRYAAFVSHAREEASFPFERLREGFADNGLALWAGSDGGDPDEDDAGRRLREITACGAFVFVVGPGSVSSDRCRQELELAARLRKLIVPIVHRDVGAGALPPELTGTDPIPLRTADDLDGASAALRLALDVDRDWRELHTRIACRALRWLDSQRDEAELLRGAELREAEALLTEQRDHRQTATPDQVELITRSRWMAGRRQRRLAGAALAALAVVTALAVYAFVERQHAIDQTHVAQSHELAGRALDAREADPQLASLLALRAYRLAPTFEARNAILAVAENHQLGSPIRTGRADSVAFSPDGRMLATPGARNTVRLWSVATHRQVGAPLAGHTRSVHAVAFSPDGRRLASGGDDGTLRLWSVASHRQLGPPLGGHGVPVKQVAFAPDGRLLAAAGDDGGVRIWDAASRREAGTPIFGRTTAAAVAFSPNRRTLATTDGGGTARLWNARTHHLLAVLKPRGAHAHGALRTSIAFSPDGRRLAASSAVAVLVWDVESRRALGAPLVGHSNEVTSLAFSPDGRTLATGGVDKTVRLWDVAQRASIGRFVTGATGSVDALAFSPDGRTLATSSRAGRTQLFSVASPRELARWSPPDRLGAFRLRFTRDGELVSIGERMAGSWNWRSRHQVRVSTRVRDWTAVAVGPDGRTAATATEDPGGGHDPARNKVHLWDLAHRRELGPPLLGHRDSVNQMAFDRDGKVLASGGWDGTVRLWDVAGHRALGPPLVDPAHAAVLDLAFSPDGERLASSDWAGAVWLWDVGGHRLIRRLPALHIPIDSLAFSPDGRTIAIAPRDETGTDSGRITIRLWDAAERHGVAAPLARQIRGAGELAFSPDGGTLAVASDDTTVHLWDVATRRPLDPPLAGHGAAVTSISFSPDGRTIAAADRNGAIRIWSNYPVASDARRLCGYLDRRSAAAVWRAAAPPVAYEWPC